MLADPKHQTSLVFYQFSKFYLSFTMINSNFTKVKMVMRLKLVNVINLSNLMV
jgi:hypothetical protein